MSEGGAVDPSSPSGADQDTLWQQFTAVVRDLLPVEEFPDGAFGWVVTARRVDSLGIAAEDAGWDELVTRARRAGGARAVLLGRRVVDHDGGLVAFVLHVEHAEPAAPAREIRLPVTLGDRPPKPSRFRPAPPRPLELGEPTTVVAPRRVWV